MKKNVGASCTNGQGRHALTCCALISLFFLIFTVSIVNASEIYQDQGRSVRWDNTLKYSAGVRVEDQDDEILNNINGDDGDRNFDPGDLTSNRLDVLSELDVAFNNFGFRASAAAWVDLVYHYDNANDSPATFNGIGPNDEFADETKDLSGGTAELLDAFIWGRGDLGSVPASFRLGRHTLLWGETLFMATNGIMAGQAPIDAIKAVGVPATQAKELFMPVGQLSWQMQPTSDLSIAGFLDFEWRRSRIPPAGSYFSSADLIDAGGERLLLGPNPPDGLGPALFRSDDLGGGPSTPNGGFGEADFGQGGLAVRYRSEKLDSDLGLYWYRFHDKFPQLYLRPGVAPDGAIIDPSIVDPANGKLGEYFEVFPEGIHLVGASLGTQFGPVNVSGEMNARINMPLVSTPQAVLPGMQADNDDNPLYAVGDTLHGNISGIYLLPPGPMIGSFRLWQGGQILGEFGWTALLNETKNREARDPTRDDFATGVRLLVQPTYFQVLPRLDLDVPIGFGWNIAGRSPVDQGFNVIGGEKAGDVSAGLKFTYKSLWIFGATYTNFWGDPEEQAVADRDFVSFYIQRTF